MDIQGLDPGEPAARRDEILNHFSRIDLEFDSGQGDQIVGEESVAVETGDLVFIPAGTAHGIKNSEDGTTPVLVAEQLPGTYLQRPDV